MLPEEHTATGRTPAISKQDKEKVLCSCASLSAPHRADLTEEGLQKQDQESDELGHDNKNQDR